VAGRLKGKVALVTAAGQGIGRAIAEDFIAEGAIVIATDIDAAKLKTLKARKRARLDVLDAKTVNAFAKAVDKEFGGLDVLVNVAGGSMPTPAFEELTDDAWNAMLDLNLTGAMRCIRAALPHLRRSEQAAIVSISSVNGLAAFGEQPYSAAKAGLTMLTRNLAVEFGPAGIRVNAVAPGTVRTRVWDGQQGGADRLRPLYPLGRVGEPSDIAAAVAFLASDDAAWITGVTLPVDGGALAGPAQLLRLLD
jgi:meso-butanediol dehydrogenase/(S,S)-butanediol dehydrogenase/diacetyl reductase